MGKVIVQGRVMPEGIEIDLDVLEKEIRQALASFGDFGRAEQKPIAFGLKSLDISFIIEDAEGIIDKVEEAIQSIQGVQNFEVIDLRRAL